jgi:pilus assembly protein Flp/PilA
MNKLFARFGKDESGATAIEYALIAAIVGIGIIAALGTMKQELNTTFETVEGALSSANSE